MANDDPELVRHLQGHKGEITSLSFDRENKFIVSSSLDKTLMLWKINQNGALRFLGHKSDVLDVSFSPSGKLLASCSKDRTVRLWVPKVQGVSSNFKAHTSTVRSVQFSPDGRQLITASDDKMIKLWDVAKKKFQASMVGHTNWVRCARFSPDGRTILSCSEDKSIKLWDANKHQNIHTFNSLRGYGVHAAFHPNGWCIGVAMSNGVVKLYDIRMHMLLQHYNDHTDTVSRLAFHPSGEYLLSTSYDSTIKVLDLMEGRAIYTIEGHKGSITTVDFNENGDYFATAGADHQVFLWKTNFDRHVVVRNCRETPTARSSSDELINSSNTSNIRKISFPVDPIPQSEVAVTNVDCTVENERSKTYIAEDFQEKENHFSKRMPLVEEHGTGEGNIIHPSSSSSSYLSSKGNLKVSDGSITLNDIYSALMSLNKRIEKAEETMRNSVNQLEMRVSRIEQELNDRS